MSATASLVAMGEAATFTPAPPPLPAPLPRAHCWSWAWCKALHRCAPYLPPPHCSVCHAAIIAAGYFFTEPRPTVLQLLGPM